MIFVMCQGQQKRFPGATKHFLRVGPETIVGRTLRMLRERGHRATLVAPATPEWTAVAREGGVDLVTLPVPGECLVDGIAATERFWGGAVDPTRFLLGDVVFSRTALALSLLIDDGILGRAAHNMVTGKPWSERFSMTVAPGGAGALRDVIADVRSRIRELPGLGGLHALSTRLPVRHLAYDYTDDVDTPEEAQAYLPALERAALEDDARP